MTAGDCNWKPHPNCSPAARNTSTQSGERDERADHAGAEAQALDAQVMPVAVSRLGERKRLERQHGNTHGMRLSTMPPMNAKTIATASDSPSAAGSGAASLSSGVAALAGFGPAIDRAREWWSPASLS
jgi:hypothetical protein